MRSAAQERRCLCGFQGKTRREFLGHASGCYRVFPEVQKALRRPLTGGAVDELNQHQPASPIEQPLLIERDGREGMGPRAVKKNRVSRSVSDR